MLGASILRKEDRRFLTGRGKYVDDLQLPDMLWMALVRSPYAHAKIISIDLEEALRVDGVVGGMTGKDLQSMPPMPMIKPPGVKDFKRYGLAIGKVSFAGEPVAALIATDKAIAEDAIERVKVEYEPLPVIMAVEDAAKPDSPRVYDEWDNNEAYAKTLVAGDVEKAFAEADMIVSKKIYMNKMSASPIETRGLIASYDQKSQNLTLWIATQQPHFLRNYLAAVLKMTESQVRVITPDIGGAFGSKGGLAQPEALIASLLAIRVNRPVKWIENRTEHFTNSAIARGQLHNIELAMSSDGKILGMKDDFLFDAGVIGFFTLRGPMISGYILLNGYRIENFRINYRCIVTNKPADNPVRGYALIDPTYVMERMVDIASSQLKLDPGEVRIKNLVREDEMPYDTGIGPIYDGGNYEECLKKALTLADYNGFKQEQEEARRKGRYIGMGIAFHCSSSAEGPSRKKSSAGYEYASVRIASNGLVTLVTGASPQGQGQETSLAQVCANVLLIDPNEIRMISGDTAMVPFGVGTFASRTAAIGGSAVLLATQKLKEKILNVASHLLEVEKDSLTLDQKGVSSTNGKSIGLKEIAVASTERINLPGGMEPGLDASAVFDPPDYTFHFGAHVSTVEVDVDAGKVKVLKYFAVSDSGRLINPLIVHGQVVGGIVHGIGNALLERLVYSEDGQLLSSTFSDYHIPCSTDAPPIHVQHSETPTNNNPLGVRGAGEGGIFAAVPSIINAIDDALRVLEVRPLDAPVTPERLWKLLKANPL